MVYITSCFSFIYVIGCFIQKRKKERKMLIELFGTNGFLPSSKAIRLVHPHVKTCALTIIINYYLAT